MSYGKRTLSLIRRGSDYRRGETNSVCRDIHGQAYKKNHWSEVVAHLAGAVVLCWLLTGGVSEMGPFPSVARRGCKRHALKKSVLVTDKCLRGLGKNAHPKKCTAAR